jgi:hypothetical protein
MGKTSKYEGGSIVKSFRLPVKRFEEANNGIQMYLKRFENSKGSDSERLVINTEGRLGPIINPTEKLHIHTTESAGFGTEKPKRSLSPDLKEKLKELDPNIKLPEIKDIIEFPCGCFYDAVLFRRLDSCKIGDLDNHKALYSEK